MTSLFSSRWHRIAGFRPRLLPEARVARQRSRGTTWHVLAHPHTGRSVRFNAAAWALVGRLDGTTSVQQLWDAGLDLPHDPPTQDEVIELVARLRDAGLLQLDAGADFDALEGASRAQGPGHAAGDARRAGGSLFAWRMPLIDPSRRLARLAPLGRAAFSTRGLMLWLAAMAVLAVLASSHAGLLAAHAQDILGDPRGALLGLVLALPLKALHELAHALAVQRYGGTVRSAGVSLLMGLPMPWVDASAAAAFERRRDRLVVGAAGMMAELAVASLALPAWLALHEHGDGLAADALFTALLLAGVSTLLFNANPLQRFDGYFIACDLLDLPNLATRSRAHWHARVVRWLASQAAGQAPPVAQGEGPWLTVYAPASWAMSVALSLAAAALLGRLHPGVALLAGALLGWQVLLRPPWRFLRDATRSAAAAPASAHRVRRSGLGAAFALAALVAVPLPRGTVVRGVVWPSDEAQLRAGEEGFVAEVVARDGTPVHAGDVVLRLANPTLQTRLARQCAEVSALEATLVDAEASQATAGARTASDSGDARARLGAAQAELDRLQQRVAALDVTARGDGRVALAAADDLQGRYFKRGALVGELITPQPPVVRVAWPQADATGLQRLLHAHAGASVRLAGSPANEHAATLARDGTGAIERLPSAALSERHGGAVPTDPKDADDLRPVQPVVLVDVRLDAAPTATRLGERAWVRFDEGYAPLAWQAASALGEAISHRLMASA